MFCWLRNNTPFETAYRAVVAQGEQAGAYGRPRLSLLNTLSAR